MGSKFYRKSLTLFITILELASTGLIPSDIAKTLNMNKSHVSYYIAKGKRCGYLKQITRDAFVLIQLSQAGKNFLDRYKKNNPSMPICRLENIQFKAKVTEMPNIPVDWKRIEMHNWTQYSSQIDSVKIRLNVGKIPTLDLFPSAVDGDEPYDLIVTVVYECVNAILGLGDKIGLRLGKLELISKPEWVVYDPLAKESCKHNGQVTYDGICKINASKPRKFGEIEFFDPRSLEDYLLMPKRLKNIETKMTELLQNYNRLEENGFSTDIK